MQFKKEQSGYLTVYLTLVFGIILSLLLALVEGAAMGAARLQAELIADLGMDSIFAEYHRELFKQYGLLFIDDSYGAKNGSIAQVEEHLTDYMSYNINPKKGVTKACGYNFVSLEQTYLEIEEAAFATDCAGQVWKTQIIEYMKSQYGMDIIEGVQDQINQVESSQLLSLDVKQKFTEYQEELKQAFETNKIEETNNETQEGASYQKITDVFDSISGKGILYFTAPDLGSLSSASITSQDYVSYRRQQGNINKGSGLPDYVEEPATIVDELLFHAFLLEKCGSYANAKEGSHLQYQIEYILFGRDSDISNLRECAERLFLIRSASNYLYLTTIDTAKYNEVKTMASAICTLLCLPEVAEIVTQMIMIIWAMAEGVIDVKCLLDGGKVSIIKQKGEWQLGLSSLFSGGWKKSNKTTQTSGLSYEGYLQILLGIMINKTDKVMRSMDIAEMDIRKTPGNENFCIDQCIDYLKVSFGLTGDRGQEYVFTKTMRYE